jgi:hypothetical protein
MGSFATMPQVVKLLRGQRRNCLGLGVTAGVVEVVRFADPAARPSQAARALLSGWPYSRSRKLNNWMMLRCWVCVPPCPCWS